MCEMSEAAREARNEYARQWRKDHPDAVREQNRKYRERHPDRIKESNARYWEKKAQEMAGK